MEGKKCPFLHSQPTEEQKGDGYRNQGDECEVFVKYGRCKHGMSGKIKISGKICEGRHPKICKKLRSGGFGKNGCTKGSTCEYLHPKVCRGSVSKEKTCSDPVSCKFFHISGTRLSHPNAHQTKTKPSVKPGAGDPTSNYTAEPVTPAVAPVTMDFLQVLIREMKEGFSAQAQQIQTLTRTMHSLETGSPIKPLFGDLPTPSQEHPILGFGATHPTYQPYHLSQRFTY